MTARAPTRLLTCKRCGAGYQPHQNTYGHVRCPARQLVRVRMTELRCHICGGIDDRGELGLMPVGDGEERDHQLVCEWCEEETDD